MLQDYKPQFDTPKRQGRLALVYIQATFASGVATVDTEKSSPRVTMVKDTTGDYDITFPKGQFVHCVGITMDPATDTPTTGALVGYPRSLVAAGSNGTGTGKILFVNEDGSPAVTDPGDNVRCYITLLVGGN